MTARIDYHNLVWRSMQAISCCDHSQIREIAFQTVLQDLIQEAHAEEREQRQMRGEAGFVEELESVGPGGNSKTTKSRRGAGGES